MMRIAIALLALTSIVMAGSTTKPASAPDKANENLGPYWGMIVKELSLGETETAALEAKLKARKDALDAFDATDEGKELIRLNAERSKANKEKNTDIVKSLTKESKPLRDKRALIEAQKLAETKAIFTPEQNIQIDTYNIYNASLKQFAVAKPNDKQKLAIKNLCKACAGELGKAIDEGTRKGIRKKLAEDIRQNIAWEGPQLKALDKKASKSEVKE